MGEIVNLRRARKRKNREARELAAAENRGRFGRTKVEKAFEETRQRQADGFLDNNRLDAEHPKPGTQD